MSETCRGPGETGPLQIRGIRMVLEGPGNAQTMADSFTPDGWFITGDPEAEAF
ncbi:MAG: hypothetical protein AAGJ28_10940 [Pseudomonadota bacterium]